MKKIFFLSIAVVALSSVAITTFFNPQTAQEENAKLSNIEVLSVCEVSSDNELNKGFCIKEYDTKKDVCADAGTSESPRCFGNTKL